MQSTVVLQRSCVLSQWFVLTCRERKNRPLKNPLKELVVVHTDKDFLADIEGQPVFVFPADKLAIAHAQTPHWFFDYLPAG